MPHAHGAEHAHTHATDDSALAEMLDLDAEVLHAYWSEALSWVQQAAAGSSPRRIVDLGAGTGTGTIALARSFDGAEVLALDSSEEMLRLVQVKATDLGLADRIRTAHADLDDAWPDLAPIDITWASKSLHHLSDPDRVLRHVFAATRPGGLVAVAEFSEHLRFLPDDVGLGRPGLEARCRDAVMAEHATDLPHLGSDWSARLAAAGFADVDERSFTIALDAPHPPGTARYAQLWLQRLASGVADRLADDDREALATLVDGNGPESVHRRDDLQVRGSRTVTLGRRQEGTGA